MVGGRGGTSERTGCHSLVSVFWGIGCGLCNTFPSPEGRSLAVWHSLCKPIPYQSHPRVAIAGLECPNKAQRVTSDPHVSHVEWKWFVSTETEVRNGS
jgi:hypothetical protein